MNTDERKWKRLTSLAREAGGVSGPTEPSPGFVTRVAALAMAVRNESAGVAWE